MYTSTYIMHTYIKIFSVKNDGIISRKKEKVIRKKGRKKTLQEERKRKIGLCSLPNY